MYNWFMRQRVITTAVFSVLIFAPMAYFLNRRDLIDMMSALTIVTSGAVLITYWPGVYPLLARRNGDISDNKDFLLLGIMSLCSATFGNRIFGLWWRWFGDGQVQAFDGLLPLGISWFFFVGYMLHLSAPRVFRGGVPMINLPRISVILAIGLVLGFILDLLN